MLKVPELYRPIDLGDYAEEMAGEKLYVWVNPPRKLRREYARAVERADRLVRDNGWLSKIARFLRINRIHERKTVGWFGRIWSEDGEEPIGAQRAVEFASEVVEADPVLWMWLVEQTMWAIHRHQDDAKKN